MITPTRLWFTRGKLLLFDAFKEIVMRTFAVRLFSYTRYAGLITCGQKKRFQEVFFITQAET